jgi:hypothetical protein
MIFLDRFFNELLTVLFINLLPKWLQNFFAAESVFDPFPQGLLLMILASFWSPCWHPFGILLVSLWHRGLPFGILWVALGSRWPQCCCISMLMRTLSRKALAQKQNADTSAKGNLLRHFTHAIFGRRRLGLIHIYK